MPKFSVEDKVLAILKSNDWVASNEIEKLFPAGEPGHFSWPQRLRGLRDKGFTIDRRIKQGTKNLSEWHLTLPNAPKTASTLAETAQGGDLEPNSIANAPKASNAVAVPQIEKSREPAKDELSEMVSQGNLTRESKINTEFLVRGKQLVYLI